MRDARRCRVRAGCPVRPRDHASRITYHIWGINNSHRADTMRRFTGAIARFGHGNRRLPQPAGAEARSRREIERSSVMAERKQRAVKERPGRDTTDEILERATRREDANEPADSYE